MCVCACIQVYNMLCYLACVGDANGCQLIHEAAQHDQLHCLKFLLKASVKASATDAKGRNILHKVWFQYKGRASLCVHVYTHLHVLIKCYF